MSNKSEKHACRDIIQHIAKTVSGKSVDPIYTVDQLESVKYVHGCSTVRMGCHAGQRKLLMTEIQFLSNCTKDINLIIYAGSAPCEKLGVLLELFPTKKFLLIDPNYHTTGVPNSEVKYVYQNTNVISSDNHRRATNYIHGRNGRSLTQRRQYQKGMGLKSMSFHNSKTVFDVLNIRDPTHVKHMNQLMNQFNSSRGIVDDILIGKERVYIIQDYMTRELTEKLKESIGDRECCFISDIRTNMFDRHPTDIDIMWNDALQMIFLQTLQPMYSMIKFHPPYMGFDETSEVLGDLINGVSTPLLNTIRDDLEWVKTEYKHDPIGEYSPDSGGDYHYLSSEVVWLQCWAPKSSSEARLVIHKKNLVMPLQNYNASEWDNKFMYFRYHRGYAYYGDFYERIKHLSTNTVNTSDHDSSGNGHSYDGCFDCMLEMMIITGYMHPTDGAILNPKKLAQKLDSRSDQQELLRICKLIDSNMLYPTFSKCLTHGQVTRSPSELYYYVYEFDDAKTMLYRISSVNMNMYEMVYTSNKKKTTMGKRPYVVLADNFQATPQSHSVEQIIRTDVPYRY
jgi:hypothetical protein